MSMGRRSLASDQPAVGPAPAGDRRSLPSSRTERPRVVLLMSPATYRAGAFLNAGERLGLEIVQGIDLPETLTEYWHVPLGIDFSRPDEAVAQLVAYAADYPIQAILSVDDRATLIAAKASAALGLPHNDPGSALAARDKYVMRERLAAGGVPVPAYRRYSATDDPKAIAAEVAYPCVVKPLQLSGSRGVIRANNPDEFAAAFERTWQLLLAEGNLPAETYLLVEQYVPGVEVALEGLLTGGSLRVLALFDKPDPLEGPFFEETIYVTPSRLPPATQEVIAERTAAAAAALGLREGPVHAELRIHGSDCWLIELAGRSIGGLCSSVLEFGAGVCLEELVLRHTAGLPLGSTERSDGAAGVMMIPIPKGGILRSVDGQEEAKRVPGVTGVEITAKLNHQLVPLPEGASYLGFIFATSASPEEVESALRQAHSKLRFNIGPAIALTSIQPSAISH